MSGSHQPFIVVFQDVNNCPDCPFRRIRMGRFFCMLAEDEEGPLGLTGSTGKEIPDSWAKEAPEWCPLRNGDVIVRKKK